MFKQLLLFNKDVDVASKDHYRYLVSSIILYSVIFAVIIFATINYKTNIKIFYIDSVILSLAVSILLMGRKIDSIEFTINIMVLSFFVLVTILIYKSGGESYILLWAYAYPFITMMLLGHKKALIVATLFYIVVYIMFFVKIKKIINIMCKKVTYSYILKRNMFFLKLFAVFGRT